MHPSPLLLTIVVPVRNLESSISYLLSDLAGQCKSDVEIYVVDDCSTDNTILKVKEFETSIPGLHLIESKTRVGPGGARNLGVKRARGEYVLFLDGDDRISDTFVPTMVAASKNRDTDLIVGNVVSVVDGEYSAPILKSLSSKDPGALIEHLYDKYRLVFGSPWGKAIKTNLLLRHPFPKGCLFEDYCIALPVLNEVRTFSIAYEALYFYVKRQGSTMNSIHNPIVLADQCFSIALRAIQLRKLAARIGLSKLESEKSFGRIIDNINALTSDHYAMNRTRSAMRLTAANVLRVGLEEYPRFKIFAIAIAAFVSPICFSKWWRDRQTKR